MDPRFYIVAQVENVWCRLDLTRYGAPTFGDLEFIRACAIRLQRGETAAWQDFLNRLSASLEVARNVFLALRERFVVEFRSDDSDELALFLPSFVKFLSEQDEKQLLRLCDFWEREEAAESLAKFTPPHSADPGEIRYVEMKSGVTGSGRIGRVLLSKTRKTIYYGGRTLQSLKGGYKANFYDIENRTEYWVSRCKKDGNDSLYPTTVEIDDDVRDEYWTIIRKQPENKDKRSFRSIGKYGRGRPC